MSRRPSLFRQTDLTRAVKGALEAGIAVERIEIDKDARIAIVSRSQPETEEKRADRNEWDADP